MDGLGVGEDVELVGGAVDAVVLDCCSVFCGVDEVEEVDSTEDLDDVGVVLVVGTCEVVGLDELEEVGDGLEEVVGDVPAAVSAPFPVVWSLESPEPALFTTSRA